MSKGDVVRGPMDLLGEHMPDALNADSRARPRTHRSTWTVSRSLVCGLIWMLTAGCSGSGSSGTSNGAFSATSQNQTPDTTEYKLAVVDAGTYVRPDDLVVARFRSLLSQLSTRWEEIPARLADMSVAAKQQLRKFGIDQEILGFMEGMNLITPVAGKGFPEYASLYIVMRNQGRSHDAAIATLRIAKASDFPR